MREQAGSSGGVCGHGFYTLIGAAPRRVAIISYLVDMVGGDGVSLVLLI